MAKNITIPHIDLAHTGSGQQVTDASIAPTIEAGHWLYGRSGTTWANWAFDPLLSVTSTSYTQVNTTANGDTLVRWPMHTAVRPVLDSGTKYWVRLIVWGRNVTVRCTPYDSTDFTGLEVSCGSPWEQSTLTVSSFSPLDELHLIVEAKVSSGTGYVAAIVVQEGIISSGTNLPVG